MRDVAGASSICRNARLQKRLGLLSIEAEGNGLSNFDRTDALTKDVARLRAKWKLEIYEDIQLIQVEASIFKRRGFPENSKRHIPPSGRCRRHTNARAVALSKRWSKRHRQLYRGGSRMTEADIQSKIRVSLSPHGVVFRTNSGEFFRGQQVYSKEFKQDVLINLRRIQGLPKGFSDLVYFGRRTENGFHRNKKTKENANTRANQIHGAHAIIRLPRRRGKKRRGRIKNYSGGYLIWDLQLTTRPCKREEPSPRWRVRGNYQVCWRGHYQIRHGTYQRHDGASQRR